MVYSLKDLSFMAMASTVVDNHIPSKLLKHSPKFTSFCSQEIKRLELPKPLESELILVVREFEKREIDRNQKLKDFFLELTYPSDDKDLKKIVNDFYSDPSLWIPTATDLWELFPEENDQKKVIKLFVTLFVPRFCENPEATIRDCWSSDSFVHLQEAVLDNFVKLREIIVRTTGYNYLDAPGPSKRIRRNLKEKEVIHSMVRGCFLYGDSAFDNHMLPWFVFEVLNSEQRNKMHLFEETTLLAQNSGYKKYYILTPIFMHWPWENRAFEMFFAWKEKLSEAEETFLRAILTPKRETLRELGISPNDIYFCPKLRSLI